MATIVMWLRRSFPTLTQVIIIDNDLIRYLFARDLVDK